MTYLLNVKCSFIRGSIIIYRKKPYKMSINFVFRLWKSKSWYVLYWICL